MSNHLHIISFDVPFPADYGGAIDIFYKIKQLFQLGIKIHFHCFKYRRKPDDYLNKFCESVNYYIRPLSINNFFSTKPFIVKTRNNKQLLSNLLNDNYPILFEGIHTCFFLDNPFLSKRKKFVRMHNIEHEYYAKLAANESNIFRKLFFVSESLKLKCYENILQKAQGIFTISQYDTEYYSSKYNNVNLIHAFHQFNDVISNYGQNNYILFHGNLSVAENIRSAEFLIYKVFSKIDYSCIITGKNPSEKLKKACQKFENIQLISNPSESEMNHLIENAQIIVLPGFQQSGMKIKLLASLFSGRYCVVGEKIVSPANLEKLCEIAEKPEEYIKAIHNLMNKPFNTDEMNKRKQLLKPFLPELNAKEIIRHIFD